MKTTQDTLNWKKWSTLLGAVAIIGVAGCADRNNNNVPESPATSGEVANATDGASSAAQNTAENAGDAAQNAVGTAGDAVQNAAETAGDAAKNAVGAASDVGNNAAVTSRIKTAYAANPSISALAINVDTVADKKTVTLSGTVTNAAQKNLAANIAKQNAPGFKIVNNLKTSGGASPTAKKKAG